jgi:hypothetical protein
VSGCRCKKLICGSQSVNQYPTNNIGYNFFGRSAAKVSRRRPIGNNAPSSGRKWAHRSTGAANQPRTRLAAAKWLLSEFRYVMTQTRQAVFGISVFPALPAVRRQPFSQPI